MPRYFRGLWVVLALVAVVGWRSTFIRAENTDKSEIENSVGMKLRLIPAGTFSMGSPESEAGRAQDEIQHKVQVTRAFYLGKHEVTQGAWKAVMKTEPWKGEQSVKEGDDYPAVYVNWDDAVDFCKKLSRKEGKTYRLPTEAEWEYACRGATGTRFSFGDDENDLGEHGWYRKNAELVKEEYAHRVGQKRANRFGLHDMHGNVWELCSDWYDENYYAKSPTIDPQGPNTGLIRVRRGGCWDSRPGPCHSAFRGAHPPTDRSWLMGFRVVQVRSGD